MAFCAEDLRILAGKAKEFKPFLVNEEQTKNALILPFIHMLGYDYSNPKIVIPEHTMDVGVKSITRVDYAIMKDEKTIIIIECKKVGDILDKTKEEQLFNYFNKSKARIAILADGISYKFYSDLVQPNVMDEEPFLSFNLEELASNPMLVDNCVEQLSKFTDKNFNEDAVIEDARKLRYVAKLSSFFNKLFNPDGIDDETVKLIIRASNAYEKSVTKAQLPMLRNIVADAFMKVVRERVIGLYDNLTKKADKPIDASAEQPQAELSVDKSESDGIETTSEEMEAYYTVRALVGSDIDANRILFKDFKGSMAVFVDRVRQVICRLYFNSKDKKIAVFDSNGQELKIPINHVSEIIQHKEEILQSLHNVLHE